MAIAQIKQRIKKRLLLLATTQRGGIRLLIILRSCRNLILTRILGSYNKSKNSSKVDENDIKAAIHQAQNAYNRGHLRLALLLAHQCDCISEHPTEELSDLLADLRNV
jgi:hypothetical protein